MTDNTTQDDQNKNKGQIKFQETIEEHANKETSKETQEMLNKPFSASTTTLSEEDKRFLDDIIKKIEKEEIKLHTPDSIINAELYQTLSGEKQAQTNLFIQSTLFILRQIFDFYHSEHNNDSDMMIHMVHELRLKKETLEKEIGDVLKI